MQEKKEYIPDLWILFGENYTNQEISDLEDLYKLKSSLTTRKSWLNRKIKLIDQKISKIDKKIILKQKQLRRY